MSISTCQSLSVRQPPTWAARRTDSRCVRAPAQGIALLIGAVACGLLLGCSPDEYNLFWDGETSVADVEAPDTSAPDDDTRDTEDEARPDVERPDTGSEPELDEADVFFECDVDEDCDSFQGEAQECVGNVCVAPPINTAYLVDDEDHDNVVEHWGTVPETSCYATLSSPAGTNRNVSLVGLVERFGSGPTTEGLCVTVYDETVLLPWLVNSECNVLGEPSSSGTPVDQYIGCFQLDPCRCQEHFDGTTDYTAPMIAGAEAAMASAGTPMTIDDLGACYSFVGFCDGIADDAEAETCRARVAAKGQAPDTNPLILGSTRTRENSLDATLDDPTGSSVYILDNVPTNRHLALKVSGRVNLWRDTWEYGLFTRGDVVRGDWPWFTEGITDPETREPDELLFTDLGLDTPIDAIRLDGMAMSAGAWATFPPSVGLAGGVDDRHGAILGEIRDCGDDGSERNPWAVVHARVGVSFNESSLLSYFNGDFDDPLPNPARLDTNLDGTYAVIDLSPGPNRVVSALCANECWGIEYYVSPGAKNVFVVPMSIAIATFEGYFLH